MEVLFILMYGWAAITVACALYEPHMIPISLAFLYGLIWPLLIPIGLVLLVGQLLTARD